MTEYFFVCPYCWQEISIVVDLSAGTQSYTEDCEVCCNPVNISFTVQEQSIINFEAVKTD